ncbi:cupin domain-containing protein [Pseudonocardia sp. RS010]|uniref:cupin domain-containing protein n=1 Tax=Pseudonocardia sp. RS010 TaxID=3385979 RepID=UPI0039A3834A
MPADKLASDDIAQYLIRDGAISPDSSLEPERGWIDMDVRWLITKDTVGAQLGCMGRTFLVPGGKHDIHRHPYAEEWEYVITGRAVKHVGDLTVEMGPGDVIFVPRNVYHGLENASSTEPLLTVWGYQGAANLEEAGYFLPSDDGIG